MGNELDLLRPWPDAGGFYAQRDHRTQLEVQELRRYVHAPVEIHVSGELADDVTIQRMILLASNLTARWSRNLRVFVPDVALASPLRVHGEHRLIERLTRELFEANPFGAFSVGNLADPASASLRLRIGPQRNVRSRSHEYDYFIDAVGWTALGWRSGQTSSHRRRPATTPAAALAAALGAADLFKRAIGHSPEDWLGRVAWSTWDHAFNSDLESGQANLAIPITGDLGNLLIAGIGAVGSALLYILSLMELQGTATVLDEDHVDATNLNRSPLFTAEDAALARRKTEVAQRLLQLVGIRTEAVYGTWHDHGERLSREPFDAWVSLTNEHGAWAEVPFQLPPVVLHGTTTSGWGIAFGRHIPRVEDCTACRLPQPHAEFRGPCAEARIDLSAEGQVYRASLPFLSTASAALIAAELLKLRSPAASSLPNAVYADFRNGLPAVVARRLKANPQCRGCQTLDYPLWVQRGGRSRYANLSAA
jgi:hypothetical protein